jgi:hypothetical protein
LLEPKQTSQIIDVQTSVAPLPYLTVIVEPQHAGDVRMAGNLLGDPMQTVAIDADVEGVFEHHGQADPQYSLLQWRVSQSRTFR